MKRGHRLARPLEYVGSALLTAMGVLTLASCTKVDMDLRIENDRVNGTIVIGVDRQVVNASGQSQDALVSELRKHVFQSSPHGTTWKPYTDDRYVGSKAVLRDVDLVDFNGTISRGGLHIVHDGGRYKVLGTVDTRPLAAGSRAAEDRQFADAYDVRIAITFPGQVVESNGQLQGRTVTWRPRFGELMDLSAEADDGTIHLVGVPVSWAVAFSVAGFAALIVAGVLIMTRLGFPFGRRTG